MLTDYEMVQIQTPTINYDHLIKGTLTVDGLPYNGVIVLIKPPLKYISSGSISNGNLVFYGIPARWQQHELNVIISTDGMMFSQKVEPSNATIYDLAISTNGGGGAPTGDPATITGKVERVLDSQAEAVERQLVAVEHKPDGSWSVTGDTLSDSETGSYILNVLTEGGDTFVLAMDEYGQPFTATAAVVQGDLVHPNVPNGYVYRVESGGTLPATEPTWWVDTGANHTRNIDGGVTLRAIPFYRPLAHGPIKAKLLP